MSSGDPFPGRPRTAQHEWFDAQIRHQIGLLRYSGGLDRRVVELLDDTEAELRKIIARRLKHHTGTRRPRDLERQRAMLADLEAARAVAWSASLALVTKDLQILALNEAKLTLSMLRTVLPVQIDATLPPPALLRSIVTARPFEGRLLRQWWDGLETADADRIAAQVQIGMVQAETADQLARRIVGTVRLRGMDGATQIARGQAVTIARTAVNHTANHARSEFFKANTDLARFELFIATLDGRTTPICKATDGERFRVGEGLYPPLHLRCRSLRSAILDAEALGERPAVPVTERMLVREFAQKKGFPPTSDRDKLPRGTKAEFDDFARKRKRQLIGRVPAKTSYGEWLRTQSRQFQDDTLGPVRAKLFRTGRLTLGKFVNRAGDEIPLSQLARMHFDAFRAAGLDPTAYF